MCRRQIRDITEPVLHRLENSEFQLHGRARPSDDLGTNLLLTALAIRITWSHCGLTQQLLVSPQIGGIIPNLGVTKAVLMYGLSW